MPKSTIEKRSVSAWRVVGFVLLAIIAGVTGAALSRQFGTSSYTLSYADFISIMLTAISLLITLLGFFLAALAFLGWKEMGDRVDHHVENRTKEFLEDGFREGNSLHAMLQIHVKRAQYRGVHAIDQDLDDEMEEEQPGEQQ